tara:strand:- start:242 stop:448 length:207 start_codon:yes stop_codon:yes gene_type:complete
MRTENIRLLDLENNEVLNHTYKRLLTDAVKMLNKCYEGKIEEPYNDYELGSLIVDLKQAQIEVNELLK